MTEIERDARATSTTGFEPQIAGSLAYLAGPFSGVLVLLAERTNRYVRFHAWQAILGLGGLGAITILLLICAPLGIIISQRLFTVLFYAASVTAVLWLVLWGFCLLNAYRGQAWKLPLAGPWAERLATPR
jgi:uncharacterized membrane protein